jgi:hypothetical protein
VKVVEVDARDPTCDVLVDRAGSILEPPLYCDQTGEESRNFLWSARFLLTGAAANSDEGPRPPHDAAGAVAAALTSYEASTYNLIGPTLTTVSLRGDN